MTTFRDKLQGVSDKLQFSPDGGWLKWIEDHFEFRSKADNALAKLKIAPATGAEEAVQYGQLSDMVSQSKKGTVNALIYCMNKDGAKIINATNGMLKAGTIIEKTKLEVGDGFDGAVAADANIAVNDAENTVLLGLKSQMLGEKAVNAMQEYQTPYILGEDLDLAFNLDLSADGTKGYALVHIIYVDPVSYKLLPGSQIIFIPQRKIMHLDFEGADGDTATMIVGTTKVQVGYEGGKFVFDIDNAQGLRHVYETEGEIYSFVLGGEEYELGNIKMEV